MSEKALDKLARRFEILGETHRSIVEELIDTTFRRGPVNKPAVEKHAMMASVFDGIASQLRGTIADLRNNI